MSRKKKAAYSVKVMFYNTEVDDFDGKAYEYTLTGVSKTLNKGDTIILKDDTNWDTLKVVKIIDFVSTCSADKHREYVGTADVDNYFKAKEIRQRTAEIKEELEERFEEASKLALYETLAKTDSTVAKLLAELKELTGGCDL